MENYSYRQKWFDEDAQQFHAPLPSLIETPNPYKGYALGKDFSHYDGPITPAMVRGLDFVIGKIGGSENDPHSAMGNPYEDETFANNCQVAYDAALPFIGYWFNGPRVWLENGYTKDKVFNQPDEEHAIMKSIFHQLHAGAGWKKIYEFWLDYEEASFLTTKKGGIEIPWQTWTMDDIRARLRSAIKKYQGFPDLPLVVYSRKSFIDAQEAKDSQLTFTTWMGNRPEILVSTANYPQRIPNTAGADEVRAKYLPLATWKPATFGYSAARAKSWHYWQFCGDPDWVLYNGTKEELYARLGFQTGINTNPPPDTGGTTNPPSTGTIDLSGLEALISAQKATLDMIKSDTAMIKSHFTNNLGVG